MNAPKVWPPPPPEPDLRTLLPKSIAEGIPDEWKLLWFGQPSLSESRWKAWIFSAGGFIIAGLATFALVLVIQEIVGRHRVSVEDAKIVASTLLLGVPAIIFIVHSMGTVKRARNCWYFITDRHVFKAFSFTPPKLICFYLEAVISIKASSIFGINGNLQIAAKSQRNPRRIVLLTLDGLENVREAERILNEARFARISELEQQNEHVHNANPQASA